jgi:hypothetical protein
MNQLSELSTTGDCIEEWRSSHYYAHGISTATRLAYYLLQINKSGDNQIMKYIFCNTPAFLKFQVKSDM